jgi:N utilization substance protein B
MQLADCSAAEVEAQFLQDYDMKRVDTVYLHELLSGADKHRAELTQAFSARLDRDEKELDAVSRAALLIGSFEIIHRIDIPYRVAINEGVELAKQFGAADSFKFVNSVLDSLAAEYRAVERASGKH